MLKIFMFLMPKILMSMAKVDGPLMSLEARGKIGDLLVFFPWKGRHAVRRWLKPVNPKKTLMGYVRAALKAIGKQIKVIESISGGDTVDSKLYLAAEDAKNTGDIWNAFHAQGILAKFSVADTFDTAQFASVIADYSTHSEKTAWDSEATVLGIENFTFPYGYTDAIEAGCILYFGAMAAYSNKESWGTQYELDPTTYEASDITAFEAAHTA